MTTPSQRPRWQIPWAEDPNGSGLARPNRRILYFLVAILVVGVTANYLRHHENGPTLTHSCTTPAFAVVGSTFEPGDLLRIAVTGPAAASYQVFLDIASVTDTNGVLTATPDAGLTLAQTEVVFETSTLTNCYGTENHGLATSASIGSHTLSLYEIADGKATRVQTVTISVHD